jgi:hypothetical protein
MKGLQIRTSLLWGNILLCVLWLLDLCICVEKFSHLEEEFSASNCRQGVHLFLYCLTTHISSAAVVKQTKAPLKDCFISIDTTSY